MGVTFLRHSGTADCAGRNRLFYLAKFLFHASIDFIGELTTAGGQQGQQHNVFSKVIHDTTRWHRHGRHIQNCCHASLYLQTLIPERGYGTGRPAELRYEDTRFTVLHPFNMTSKFIYPYGDFQTIGRWNRVLAMGASWQRHVLGAFCQIG